MPKILKLLCALVAALLGGCGVLSPIPAPKPEWRQHTGQIQSRGGALDVVGEISIRSDAQHFLAEVTKGPGLPMVKIYAEGSSPKKVLIRGALSRGGWAGSPASAPSALRAWALLPEMFHWASGDVSADGAFALKLTQSKRAERSGGGRLDSFSYQLGAERIGCFLNH